MGARATATSARSRVSSCRSPTGCPSTASNGTNVEVAEAGRVVDFRGYASVETAFGPAVWGTELDSFFLAGRIGRWGIYNLLTATFYPDDAGWFPVSP